MAASSFGYRGCSVGWRYRQAGFDHVLMVVVPEEILHVALDGSSLQFSINSRQGQDLVPGIFDGSGLMDADVPGGRCDDPFIAFQQGSDDDFIGLGAADQEVDCGRFQSAGIPDFFAGLITIGIQPIAGLFCPVAVRYPLEDFGMSTFHIVTAEI